MNSDAAPTRGVVARALLSAIGLYRAAISPLRPPVCRFAPSCSEYALEAIERFGPGRGSWLSLRRLLRCHPFHAGGHDPVPPRVRDGDDTGRDRDVDLISDRTDRDAGTVSGSTRIAPMPSTAA